jgi:hypothetical protein
MSISPHTHTWRKGRLVAISAWSWIIVSIIVSALIRRRDRVAGRREDSPVTTTPRASSQRPEPAALAREPGRRSRIEIVAAWTQVIGLPLAIAGLIYAGLAYSFQAGAAQQALAAIRLQQQSLAAQQRTISALQASISVQISQIKTATLSVQAEQELIAGVRQLAVVEERLTALLAARGGSTP